MENTATTATNDNGATDAAANAAGATAPADNTQPQPVDLGGFQEEALIDENTPQEDVDAMVAKELGLDQLDSKPAEAEDKAAKATEEDKETDKPAADAEKPEAEAKPAPAVKGYNPEDDKDVADANKTLEELQNAAVDTSDLWIEVKNADGQDVKITLDGGLPDDFKFANDKQVFEILDAMNEMRGIKAEREQDLSSQRQEAEAKANAANAQQQLLQRWDAEIADLIEAGEIPTPSAQPGSADFNQDPAVQRVSAVFDFIASENQARIDAGKQPIQSFGTAMRLMDAKNAKTEAETARKAQNSEAKQVGGKVGGTSAPAGGNNPVYHPGQYNSIYDIPV